MILFIIVTDKRIDRRRLRLDPASGCVNPLSPVECGRGCGVERRPLFNLAQGLTAEAVGSGEQNAPDASAREIYIFRTIRRVRVVGPEAVEFCRTRVAFTSFALDTFDLVSVNVGANSLLIDPLVNVIGKLVTCIVTHG